MGREFADLGVYFSHYFYEAVESVAAKLNARIDRTLKHGEPTSATDRLYSPAEVAWTMLFEFPAVVFFVETLEGQLRASKVRAEFPGLVVAHKPRYWIYHHPMLVLDVTKLTRLKRTSTVMIDGVYLGTDKIVHFVHMGYVYFVSHYNARQQGLSEEEAIQRILSVGAGMHPFSENSFLGRLSTGVCSNADLASDYCGFKFFRNLTEEVVVRGERRPPMLVRDGVYWRINDHVSPYSDFFTVFVTDHWNEALNPNRYNIGIETFIRQSIRPLCDSAVGWYVDGQGHRRTQEDFLQIAQELSTFFGEDYGYSGDPNELASLGTVCFENEPTNHVAANSVDDPSLDIHKGSLNVSNKSCDVRNGLTHLHQAARTVNVESLKLALSPGSAPNAADMFGRTSLHDAAERGLLANVELLLAHGADPNAADISGNRPLHLAARKGSNAVLQSLLSHGADARATNQLGRTPREEAAIHKNREAVRVLKMERR